MCDFTIKAQLGFSLYRRNIIKLFTSSVLELREIDTSSIAETVQRVV